MVKCLTSLIIKLASGNKRITSVYPLQVESTNETIGPLQHCKDRDFSMHWYWIIDSSFIKYTHTYKNRLASRFSYIYALSMNNIKSSSSKTSCFLIHWMHKICMAEISSKPLYYKCSVELWLYMLSIFVSSFFFFY